ncbi:hypothetical protein NYP20_16235 [Pseudomonas sp. N3-W]|jgi:Fe2+ or Zn2+ uptake regulation protein|uniref:DUF3486 family protein n=1 Tax=Pseudomonas fungipugnans TaxID=3024217 RepID=A0ABT6QGJ0_9PSED|nr:MULTISPECIES: hypothetical protein [unclassified Pseudomonas]MDI2590003.1 hypothetical protein [Pseudomonas sp. 681]UWF46898.1 hypothetical protein NYP20_16235 [Pseudomonas sp. N3-W]
MNATRQQQMLAGQTALARKVFEFVPIQQCWTALDIYNALIAKTSSAEFRPVRACLGQLKDQGLIREPVNGHFQRTAATPKPKREQVMSKESNQAVVSIKKPEIGALDALAALSGEVISLSDEIGKRMKALSARIEEVALSVETEREGNAEAAGKLKQLQALLKGITQ